MGHADGPVVLTAGARAPVAPPAPRHGSTGGSVVTAPDTARDWFSDEPEVLPPLPPGPPDPAPGSAPGSPDLDGPAPAGVSQATGAAARLPFFPGLEGLRGLAVIAVLVFHGGFSVARGGFLGVSTFFTLSGFLITSLLLAEHRRTGSVDLRSFWSHRFRRLLPAALATVALVVVFGVLAADPLQRQRLGADVVASVGYVANWRFVLSGQSYGDLFGAPSPVLHFWSLAIEEQFYLLYPLLAFAVLRVLRWSTRRFAVVLSALLALSLGVTLFAGFSFDRIYYGTDTRAAELLVGALLAVAVAGPRLQALAAGRVRHAQPLAVAATVGLVVMVGAWVATPHDAAWLARGGFVLYAALSALVLAGALLPRGPLAVVLTSRPLRLMGRISYGVYLYHWPIFIWLDEENTGFHGLALFGYQLVVTIGLASLSYRYLEMPVREGRSVLPGRDIPLGRAALGAAGALAVLAVVLSATAPPLVNDFAAAQQQLQQRTARAAAPAASSIAVAPTTIAAAPVAAPAGATPAADTGAARTAAPAAAAPLPAVPRTAIFGDSTMLTTGLGLGDVLTETGRAAPVGGHTELGCGLGRGGERRSAGAVETVPDRCASWPDDWAQVIDQLQPDVAIVQEGPWDAAERRLPGDSTWRAPGDPVYDAYLTEQIDRAVGVLTKQGARVVWLTSPPVNENVRHSGQPELDQLEHPERIARVNELVRQVAARHPGVVSVVDLSAWLVASNDDLRLRPDGVHLGDAESREVAQRWLAAEVIRAAGGA